jgi:spore coat protein U-like protein
MKRYMSFVLAVVLVLGLAAVTSAEGKGSLGEGNTISATLDVSANIGKYASISAEGLNFGVLLLDTHTLLSGV